MCSASKPIQASLCAASSYRAAPEPQRSLTVAERTEEVRELHLSHSPHHPKETQVEKWKRSHVMLESPQAEGCEAPMVV